MFPRPGPTVVPSRELLSDLYFVLPVTLLVGVSDISVTLFCGLLEAAVPPDSRRVPCGVGDTSAIVVSELAASWVDSGMVTGKRSFFVH